MGMLPPWGAVRKPVLSEGSLKLDGHTGEQLKVAQTECGKAEG
jgi:hypothetical protein